MKRSRLSACLVVLILAVGTSPSWGQLFGNRSKLGSPNPTTSGTSTTSGGTTLLRGNERFLRGNRRPGEFVGSEKKDRREFVGSQQAGTTPQVGPVVPRVPVDRNPNVNTTPASSVNRKSGAYEPRLVVGFDVPALAAGRVNEELSRRLRLTPGLEPTNRIEVSVEGRTAMLRGEVASERDRSLVERLILFEPGISAVRNDLVVKPPAAGPAGPRPAASKPPAASSPRDRPPLPRPPKSSAARAG